MTLKLKLVLFYFLLLLYFLQNIRLDNAAVDDKCQIGILVEAKADSIDTGATESLTELLAWYSVGQSDYPREYYGFEDAVFRVF